MTMIDDRPGIDHTVAAHTNAADTLIQPDGAYCADVLRVVRGTPNAEELAALVAALLLTRRAHEESRSPAPETGPHRPTWPRDRYAAPGSWAAGS
jgi:hypothetical protein